MKLGLTFDDVVIVPGYSDIKSRADVELDHDVGYYAGILPVVSANMDTVTGVDMAKAMNNCGGWACLHRFMSIEENVNAYLQCEQTTWCSVGVGKEELNRAKALFDVGCRIFVIDVAHGAQMQVADQFNAIKKQMPVAFVIVGNFGSTKSINRFLGECDMIPDGLKLGIGSGATCQTRVMTGAGYPQLSLILEVSEYFKDFKHKPLLISDGGIKNPGDVAKALGAGADIVMVGSMLSGTDATPGEVFEENGVKYKKFRGSASLESYKDQGKDRHYIAAEGVSANVLYKGPTVDVLKNIEGGLRSAMTYVSARNLKEFREKVDFVQVTTAGFIEGTPHIKRG